MNEKKNDARVVWDWFDHPQNLRRLRIGFYAVLVLLVVPDFFLHKHTYFFNIEGWPGYFAAFGFLSCVAIILISKLLGYVLKRPEDYYEH